MPDHTTHDSSQKVPYGYCRCGCGKRTQIAPRTDDMVSKGRHVPGVLLGESSANAKLTNDQVIEIRRLASNGVTQVEIGRRFGVTPKHIGKIVRRELWKHLG